MIYMMPFLNACSVFLISVFLIFDGKQQESTNVKSEKAITSLDSVINAEARNFMRDTVHIGLSIGILHNGKSFNYHFGTIEKGKDVLPDQNTVYEIASITKTFTGILLAQAVIERKIRLNDPVTRYIGGNYPNLTWAGRAVQIIDLADHTAGFPKNIPDLPKSLNPANIAALAEDYTKAAFLKNLKSVKLQSKPGSEFSYSNAGPQLLEIILEKVYGLTYEEMVKKEICGPNNMKSTGTVISGTNGNTAKGYSSKGIEMPEMEHMQHLPAAGYLKSSVSDMLKYLKWNMNEQNNRAVSLSHRPTFLKTEEGGNDIGLFWFIKNERDQPREIMHAGGSFGTTTFCQIIPGSKKAIVCFANDAGADTEKELKALSARILSDLK